VAHLHRPRCRWRGPAKTPPPSSRHSQSQGRARREAESGAAAPARAAGSVWMQPSPELPQPSHLRLRRRRLPLPAVRRTRAARPRFLAAIDRPRRIAAARPELQLAAQPSRRRSSSPSVCRSGETRCRPVRLTDTRLGVIPNVGAERACHCPRPDLSANASADQTPRVTAPVRTTTRPTVSRRVRNLHVRQVDDWRATSKSASTSPWS
jgi:hypothetical protein